MGDTAVKSESDMLVLQVPLERIVPDPTNPRLEDDDLVERLAENIRLDGLTRPLVLDQDLMLVSGHKQYQALQLLGYEKAPCIVRTFESEHDRKRVNLAQNNLNGENDPDKLKFFVKDFKLEELELVGFEVEDIEALLDTKPDLADDEMPEELPCYISFVVSPEERREIEAALDKSEGNNRTEQLLWLVKSK